MAQTLTPKEIALDFGTSPKKLRKFLRSPEGVKVLGDAANPGKGQRYAIERKSLARLRKGFAAWIAANAAKAAEKAESDTTPDSPPAPEAPVTPEGAETDTDA